MDPLTSMLLSVGLSLCRHGHSPIGAHEVGECSAWPAELHAERRLSRNNFAHMEVVHEDSIGTVVLIGVAHRF